MSAIGPIIDPTVGKSAVSFISKFKCFNSDKILNL